MSATPKPAADLRGSTGRGRGSSALVALPPPAALVAAHLDIQILLPETATLRQAAGAFLVWLRDVRRYAPNTLTSYARDLKGFLTFCEGLDLLRPRDVRHAHVELFMAMLNTRGAAPTTCNRALACLRTFWKYLRREDAVATNPPGDCFSLKEPQRLPDYLTVAEQERVLSALKKDRSLRGQRDCALVATGLLCGLRCEELATLRVADVDLRAGVLRVVGKGRKERQVPVVPRLQRLLRAYLGRVRPALLGQDGSPFVFVNGSPALRGWRDRHQGEPLRTRTVYRIVHLTVSPLVGRPVHPHMLRHSWASRLREAGGDLQLIGEALGHSVLSTSAGYAHLTTPQRTAEVARLLGDQEQGRRTTPRRTAATTPAPIRR